MGEDAAGVWQRLRQRKLVQWALAYLAGAWAVLEVLDLVGQQFGWPPLLLRGLTGVLALGFFVTLTLAWYHGERGEQRVSGTELLILALLLSIGGGLLWHHSRASPTAATAEATKAQAAGTQATAVKPDVSRVSDRSIAVLPFVNMSGDKDNQYFSDGISEELLNSLVRVDGLGVASRTSSFAYKGRDLSASQIASELKVRYILEGSVRKSAKQVRITAQLIDASNDRHLWSETYDRELTDIFKIQDEIAKAIVAALRGTLGAVVPAQVVGVQADTENLEAYDLYLKARELFLARTDLKESVRLFERVVALDPEFARGWEGLAAVSAIAKSWGLRDRDYTAVARLAARKALELDASLSMPWAALSMAEQGERPVDWVKAFAMLDKAIAADPKNASAHLWRGIAWAYLGFFERAIADKDRCLAIDPAYQNCLRWKAQSLISSGNTEAGLKAFERGIAAGFSRNRGSAFLLPLVKQGNGVAAHMLLYSMDVPPELGGIVIAALSNPKDRPPNPRALVERHLAQNPALNDTVGPRLLYLWLGAFDEAAGPGNVNDDLMLPWESAPPGWRNSPAFKRFLNRSGVPAYWQQHGFPPQCRAIGDKDFVCDDTSG